MKYFQTKPFQNPNKPVTKVRLAYILALHGRSYRQIMRLLKRIYHPDDYFYIHIDARSDYLYDSLKILHNGKNVFIAENRFTTIWSGTSLLQMYLNAMQKMVEMDWKFDFVTTISGADYILKKPEEFKSYLSQNIGLNFVSTVHEKSLQVIHIGYNYTFVECDEHLYLVSPRTLPTGKSLILYHLAARWLEKFVCFVDQTQDG